MSKVYWGLRETKYGGTASFGGPAVAVVLDLKFRDEQSATFTVTPEGGTPFTIAFQWTWWEDKQEAWINVTDVESTKAKSVGSLKGKHLQFTATAADPLQLLGATGTVLEIDATEQI